MQKIFEDEFWQNWLTLREKCPYWELFWSAFSSIWTEYGEILRISPYSVLIRKNAEQNKSEYGHALSSVRFYDKMDLPIRMTIIFNLKQRYSIHLKFEDKFLTSLTKLLLEAKASIGSAIKENVLLYCLKISSFIVIVII